MTTLFIFHIESRNIIASGPLPDGFDPVTNTNLELGGVTLRGINWANVDYEVTDSDVPADLGIMDKYRYINGAIVANLDYTEGIDG